MNIIIEIFLELYKWGLDTIINFYKELFKSTSSFLNLLSNGPPTPDIDSQQAPRKYELVKREEWGAAPPPDPEALVDYEELPLNKVLMPQTYTRKCNKKRTCIKLMQEMQQEDIKNGCPDMKHNFYVGGDGRAYEGRGWEKERETLNEDDFMAHESITIAFIGTYNMNRNEENPRAQMAQAVLQLIEEGIALKYLAHYTLYNSLQLKYAV